MGSDRSGTGNKGFYIVSKIKVLKKSALIGKTNRGLGQHCEVNSESGHYGSLIKVGQCAKEHSEQSLAQRTSREVLSVLSAHC